MKATKKFIVLPMMLLSMALTGCAGNNPTTSSRSTPDYTYATEPTGEKAYSGTYYDGFDFSAVGGTLLYNLHVLTLSRHTTMVRYSQFSTYEQSTTQPRSVDTDAAEPSKNVLLYTGKKVSKPGSGWNREHVWPCANSGGMWTHNKEDGDNYVDKSTYVGGGSDLYHVRPATSSVNTARGNSKFIEFGPNDTFYEYGDGGPYKLKCDVSSGQFANKCEPADGQKGDIARILMYVYTRYNKIGDYNDKYCGTLALTNVFGYSTQEEAQEIMCKWNAIDPVDDTERLRNDTIEKIQGNRNPFVDHPELMAPCFGLF